jgi:hypothetical protein
MVLENKEYRDFYRGKSDQGDYVTLDNSSFEVGDGVYSNEDLVYAAKSVRAHEIMAPETYLDANSTYAKVAAFNEYLVRKRNTFGEIKVFATLHGRTITDIVWLYRKYLQMRISTIGISCRLDPPNFGIEHNNEAFRKSWSRFQIVRKLMPHYINASYIPEHHLLGMNFPGEISLYKSMPIIRSCDSSAAYLNGILRRSIDRFNYVKPPGKIDFNEIGITAGQCFNVSKNIDLLADWGRRDDDN